MTLLAIVRHGPTLWNEEKRVQGRTDIPLSDVGRALVRSYRVPAELSGFDWICSPLGRCRETARMLVGREVPTDPRLAEMDWGEWSGELRPLLADRYGAAFRANEARGLDFQPPGGESPRMVQMRLLPLFAEIARAGRPTVAVAHRGVTRAVLARATGWTMTGKPPFKLAWDCAHLFELAPDGEPSVHRLNLPLRPEAAPA